METTQSILERILTIMNELFSYFRIFPVDHEKAGESMATISVGGATSERESLIEFWDKLNGIILIDLKLKLCQDQESSSAPIKDNWRFQQQSSLSRQFVVIRIISRFLETTFKLCNCSSATLWRENHSRIFSSTLLVVIENWNSKCLESCALISWISKQLHPKWKDDAEWIFNKTNYQKWREPNSISNCLHNLLLVGKCALEIAM